MPRMWSCHKVTHPVFVTEKKQLHGAVHEQMRAHVLYAYRLASHDAVSCLLTDTLQELPARQKHSPMGMYTACRSCHRLTKRRQAGCLGPWR